MNPRQTLKAFLQGKPPERPLLLPLIFAAAANTHDVPLPTFLADPTRLANTLRRMHGSLKSDGVTAYYDSALAAEALGCKLSWETYPPAIAALSAEDASALWEQDPAGIEPRGRIPAALEVVRRLRSMLGEATLVMVGLTGPETLAAQLVGTNWDANGAESEGLLAFTLATVRHLALRCCEAGADIIVVTEQETSRVATFTSLWKVIRFHEALPVLLCTQELTEDQLHHALSLSQDVLLCLPPTSFQQAKTPATSRPLGLALPLPWCETPEQLIQQLAASNIVFGEGVSLVTTAGEVPYQWAVRQLPTMVSALRRACNV